MHFGPHDLSHRQMAREANAETISQIAESLGIQFTILPKEKIQKGILTVKERFPILHIDGEHCAKALYALKNYHREYDEERKIFKDIPVHDWSSNCADMIRHRNGLFLESLWNHIQLIISIWRSSWSILLFKEVTTRFRISVRNQSSRERGI